MTAQAGHIYPWRVSVVIVIGDACESYEAFCENA